MVTGFGFLGAGMILNKDDRGEGLAIGAGLYLPGLVTALRVGVILALRRVLRIDKYLIQSRLSREVLKAEAKNRDRSPDQW